VVAAGADRAAVMTAGIAGLVAGAMSMAAGEYVSVSSQADSESSDLARERRELATDAAAEHRELTDIYVGRGLDRQLAEQVATQLTMKDALGAHARDELGISELMRARPIQAALASAFSFAAGAALPLLVATIGPPQRLAVVIAVLSLASLAVLGAVAARVGRARVATGALRVTFWGAIAMTMTAAIGRIFGVNA
jgi:VIT1/CCC1 family predicted Fe2+/Mn2+ transporter